MERGLDEQTKFFPERDESLKFIFYDPQEVILGKTMEEWLRFSVCFWHSFRGTGADPFGLPTIKRAWDDGTESMENYRRRMMAAFEFFSKLGVKYWTFHDRDIAPEGDSLDETNANLDEMTDLAFELQQKFGIKCLWATCNLFSHPRYMSGAATNPDAHVFAHAAAQVKKCLEVAKKLGAENFVFWGGREGYQTLLNTNLKKELSHMATFFRMVVDYKEKIGFTGQLLIEPKPKEPMKHQYDYDAMTTIGFLKTFGLEEHYKLNVEPNHTTLAGHGYEHDVAMASAFGMLGSIDANTGSPDLGWDTDQFPTDAKNATLIMYTVLQQGGLQPGGLNFDAKIRRESTDVWDLFKAHISAMDTFAKGLKTAAKMVSDNIFALGLKDRYCSFDENLGQKIEAGRATLEDCDEYIRSKGQPELSSGRQEHWESLVNSYLYS